MALNPSDVGIMCEYAETLARSGALRVGDAGTPGRRTLAADVVGVNGGLGGGL